MTTIGPEAVLPLTQTYTPRTLRANLVPLDHNEGPAPSLDLLAMLRDVEPELLRRYRTPAVLEAEIAASFGLEPDCVLVTAGGDEAIDRCCRSYLTVGRTIVLAQPTFEMFAHYARLARAEIRTALWPSGPFPLSAVLTEIERARDTTRLIPVVSPNNPTGETACSSDLHTLSQQAPRALIVVDHAYIEYGGEDLTRQALALPNAVVLRTFSKARGLAGCRVGYTLGPPPVIAVLRATGAPYPVSSLSLALAARQWRDGAEVLKQTVQRTCREREALQTLLAARGLVWRRSSANFVTFQLGRGAAPLAARMQTFGYSIKTLGGLLEGWVRLSLPCDETIFQSLIQALAQSLDCCANGDAP
ncbi:MAG: histidinol-phosphate transaminase [Acidobacteriota bacterium]